MHSVTAADEPASGLGGCGPCTLESPFCLFNVFCTVELVRSTTMKGAGDAVAAGVEIAPLALVCPGKIVKAHVLGGLFWQGSECSTQVVAHRVEARLLASTPVTAMYMLQLFTCQIQIE